MKTFITALFLLFSFTVFAQNPAAPASPSAPVDWTVKTESGVNSPEFSDCLDCGRLVNGNPVNAQGEQLVINWERVRSRYSFSSLSKEDQAALLRDLGPGDRETLAERSARLKIKPPTPVFATGNGGGTIQDRLGGGLGQRLGMRNTKIKIKLGKNPGIKIEKKF